ncbi:hypothetical protein GCM10009845_06200 [Pedococcus bigeumensis]
MSAAIVDRAMAGVWQKLCPQRQFCHSWLYSVERMITDMTIFLLLAFVTALVFAVERHHRRTWSLPHAPHGADSTIAFSDLDHDWDRVIHDATARS